MNHVFISYSHIDTEVADEITNYLESFKIPFFRDVKNIEWGDSISDEVQSALDKSDTVLVIISPASLKSQWVPYELGYCTALKCRILPFLTHPSLDLPNYIANLKYLQQSDLTRKA